MSNSETISLFSSPDEKKSLLLPFPFFVAALLEMAFFDSLSPGQMALWRGLAATVFLNSTHVGMTFSTLFILPEAKRWVTAKWGLSPSALAALLTVLILALTCFFLTAFPVFGEVAKESFYSLLIFVLYNAFLDWHGYGQSLGLSLVYNKKLIKQREGEQALKSKVSRFEKHERFGVQLFIIFNTFLVIFLGLYHTDYIQSVPQLKESYNLVYYGGMILLGTIVFFILISNAKISRWRETNKIFFSLRYILWPLSYFSFFALIGTLAVHGFEYYYLSKQMANRSELSSQAKKSWLLSTLIFCSIAFLAGASSTGGFPKLFSQYFSFDLRPFMVGEALIMAVTVLHAFWDKLFFKINTPLGHETSGKLLV